ncbi:uncharacterized protein OCT59_006007 [Rhizophagus irregularis]|uniref:Uncharacterized protein n=1 Tax=Rhizophagus irregularis (strain DAOM 197198w) TaxID=1432141 RepID=A0A015J6S7_RHIIW|nr:hypothetical protein RirG_269250 [Rhizophagus irregularis DAOM 197198w]UZO14551.1 hypothetical protein OCT59_006007 [Rhizophagus irregularis]GBC38274.1 hypothetical protein RIR_jg4636.t1 [Rhizophagus irregularis DAOM 181602=DAOM 197198]
MSDIDSVATMNHKQQQISVTNTGYISCDFSGATSYAPSNYEESFVTQSFPMFNSSFYRILYDRRYRQQLRHSTNNIHTLYRIMRLQLQNTNNPIF